MEVFIIIFLGLISTAIGQSASLTAMRNKMAQASLTDQQGLTSDIQSSPVTKNSRINNQNALPINLPQGLLQQDVSQSVRLQEQVSQLSMTQLDLSRQILARIMELQTQLPKPLHQVMDKTGKNRQIMPNIPTSQIQPLSSPSQSVKNIEVLKANVQLVKPNQSNIDRNTNIPTSPRRLGLATISKDTMTSKPALPQQTVVLIDPQPNSVSSIKNNVASTNTKMQPPLVNTIQPILNAIRSRMASSISSPVHSSHLQLGKEPTTTLFVDHAKKLPNKSQMPSTNFNIMNANTKSNPSTIPKSIQVSPQASNFQSPSTHKFPDRSLGVKQSALTKGLPMNIPKVKDSSLMFVTLPSQLANSSPSAPPPPINFESNSGILNTMPNHSTVKSSNNFDLPQNLHPPLEHSHVVSNKNPHQSLESIVSELHTLIAKLEFLQYDLKLSKLLQSNPGLSSSKVPHSPAINTSTKNIQGSLKKSPAIFPDNFSAFSSDLNSLPQNFQNNHQVQQTPFSLNLPIAQTLGAESRNHPVIQSLASVSQNQPINKKITDTTLLPVQTTDASTSANHTNKRRFNQWWREHSQWRPFDKL